MASVKDVRELLERAQAAGWEYLGITGHKHHRLRWPATEQVLSVSSTPGPSAVLRAEDDLARISGPLRDKPGPGRTKAQRAEDRRRRENRHPQLVAAEARPALPDWKDKLRAMTWIDDTEHCIENRPEPSRKPPVTYVRSTIRIDPRDQELLADLAGLQGQSVADLHRQILADGLRRLLDPAEIDKRLSMQRDRMLAAAQRFRDEGAA